MKTQWKKALGVAALTLALGCGGEDDTPPEESAQNQDKCVDCAPDMDPMEPDMPAEEPVEDMGLMAVCGDGMIEGDEECDDGNTESWDGCSAACTEEVCPSGQPPFSVWPDTDEDGAGDTDASPQLVCELDAGFAANGLDCDDTDDDVSRLIDEMCDDGVDNDCDALVDCEDPSCEGSCLTCTDGIVPRFPDERATFLEQDRFDPSCGAAAGEDDLVLFWEADRTGEITLREETFGYADTVFVIEGDCAGAEIACANVTEPFEDLEVTFQATEGQTYLIGLQGEPSLFSRTFRTRLIALGEEANFCADGYDNDDDGVIDCGDDACVGTDACGCLDGDIGEGFVSFSANPTGEPNFSESSCGGSGGPEQHFTWTPSETGGHRIRSTSAFYESTPMREVLYVHRGATCGAPEPLECSAAPDSPVVLFGDGYLGGADLRFTASVGETYTIVVDSHDGGDVGPEEFVIEPTELSRCDDGVDNDSDGRVDCRDDECVPTSACVQCLGPEDLGQEHLLSGNYPDGLYMGEMTDAGDRLVGSCGTNGLERTITWEAPMNGGGPNLWRFWAESDDFTPTLYVLEGHGCTGQERYCSDGSANNSDFIEVATGEEVTIVVDGASAPTDTFELNIIPLLF